MNKKLIIIIIAAVSLAAITACVFLYLKLLTDNTVLDGGDMINQARIDESIDLTYLSYRRSGDIEPKNNFFASYKYEDGKASFSYDGWFNGEKIDLKDVPIDREKIKIIESLLHYSDHEDEDPSMDGSVCDDGINVIYDEWADGTKGYPDVNYPDVRNFFYTVMEEAVSADSRD